MPSRSKFHNVRTVVDGIVFASALESRRYRELVLLARAGEITDLVLQPEYTLIPAFRDSEGKAHRATKYLADFGYKIGTIQYAEDTKGERTDVFRIKEKLMLLRYPEVRFRVLTKKDVGEW